jgi:hypothetical protein
MNPTLWTPQNPAFLPPFKIFLQPGSQAKVVPPRGIYFAPGETLYFYGGADLPNLMEQPGPGNSPSAAAATFLPGMPPAVIASFTGMPLVIQFQQDGAAYAWGDGRGSKVVLQPGNGLQGTLAVGPSIVIFSGELLLMTDVRQGLGSQNIFIAPAAWALSRYNIQSFGG